MVHDEVGEQCRAVDGAAELPQPAGSDHVGVVAEPVMLAVRDEVGLVGGIVDFRLQVLSVPLLQLLVQRGRRLTLDANGLHRGFRRSGELGGGVVGNRATTQRRLFRPEKCGNGVDRAGLCLGVERPIAEGVFGERPRHGGQDQACVAAVVRDVDRRGVMDVGGRGDVGRAAGRTAQQDQQGNRDDFPTE